MTLPSSAKRNLQKFHKISPTVLVVASHVAENVMSIIAIDFNIVEVGVGGTEGLGELLDLGIILGCLVHELVAKEPNGMRGFGNLSHYRQCRSMPYTYSDWESSLKSLQRW